MSDPATFQACTFRALRTSDVGSVRQVEGTMRWRLAPELPMPDYMTTWDGFGYKTAFNILTGQTIQAFSYTDVTGNQITMIERADEAREAGKALGQQDGYKWVAFVCPDLGARRPRRFTSLPQDDHTIEFAVKVTLGFQNPNPEVIGVATRLRVGLFANGSMNLLWAIPPAPYPSP
jgi:hypothetical protein